MEDIKHTSLINLRNRLDEIEKELTELDNMKVDGEVFTTAVNFAKKILQELLEERN